MKYNLEQVNRAFRHYHAGMLGTNREYAVIAPLVETDAGLSLLFQQRSRHVKRQPLEVCFPGGGLEAGETPWECALRETNEELGLEKSDLTFISPLDKLLVPGGLLHPFLCSLQDGALCRLRINQAEVEKTFTVPLDHFFQKPTIYPYRWVREIGDDFPYEKVGYPGKYPWSSTKAEVLIWEWGDLPIWGMTATVIQRIVEILAGTPRECPEE